MDRQVMYKSNFNRADTRQQQKRTTSNKQRADNRSKNYLIGRNINCSLSSPKNFSITKTKNSSNDKNKNEKFPKCTSEKQKTFIEKYFKWKQERLEKENKLKEERNKMKKPFVSIIKSGTNFPSINSVKEIKHREPLKYRKISDKPSPKVKNRFNPIQSPKNQNGLYSNYNCNENYKINKSSPPLVCSFVTSTSRKPSSAQNTFTDILSPIEKDLSEENGLPNHNNDSQIEKSNASCKSYNVNQNHEQNLETKKTIDHLRNSLNDEFKRLIELHEKWKKYKEINNEKFTENSKAKIINFISEINILISEKLKSFGILLNECEGRILSELKNCQSTTHIQSNDIKKDWSIIKSQIEEVDKKLVDLNKLQVNNWNDPNQIEHIKQAAKKKKILSKNLKRVQQQKIKPNKGLEDLLLKARDIYIKKTLNQTCENHNENFIIKNNMPIVSHPLTPLRRSIRLSSKAYNSSQKETPKVISTRQLRMTSISNSLRSKKDAKDKIGKVTEIINCCKSKENVKIQSVEIVKHKITKNDVSVIDLCRTPENSSSPNSINYVSPFVTLSRGKVSIKKEKEKRDSLYKLEISSPQYPLEIRRLNEAVKYFRNILNEEKSRLNANCMKWEKYAEENYNIIEEYVNGMINATIGQTKLLINKKMKQFDDLINQCHECILTFGKDGTTIFKNENNSKEKRTILPEDLEGFWSMVCLQIDNVDKRFGNLEKWLANDWKDPDEINVPNKHKQVNEEKQKKSVLQKNLKRKQPNIKKPQQFNQGLREMIKKAQMQYSKNCKQTNSFNNANEDVIFVSNQKKNDGDSEIINGNTVTTLKSISTLDLSTPLRRSARLLNKKDSRRNSLTLRHSSTRQARLQEITQKLRSRSNTPQKQTTPKDTNDKAINSKSAKQTKIKDITHEFLLPQSEGEKKIQSEITSQIQKSILKPPNSTKSKKGRVEFSKKCLIAEINSPSKCHDISGVEVLDDSGTDSLK